MNLASLMPTGRIVCIYGLLVISERKTHRGIDKNGKFLPIGRQCRQQQQMDLLPIWHDR
jgi:hypothetical protein